MHDGNGGVRTALSRQADAIFFVAQRDLTAGNRVWPDLAVESAIVAKALGEVAQMKRSRDGSIIGRREFLKRGVLAGVSVSILPLAGSASAAIEAAAPRVRR